MKTTVLRQDILFSIIRASLGLPTEKVQISDEEFLQLWAFGKRQSILPLIWEGTRLLYPHSEWKQKVQDDLNDCIKRYVWRDESLRNVRHSLDENNIPYVLLKGSVLQSLYPEEWMRTSSDIDILVREKDLSNAVNAIENQTSFRAKAKGYHDVSMISENYHLELHFSLREREIKIDPLLESAWEYAKPTGEGLWFRFTPEYEIFYVTAHMAHHFINGGLGIRPFIDLWLLRNRTTYDEAVLNDLLDACDLKLFYEKCCALSSVWIDGKEHSEITLSLEKFCLSGGALGSRTLANVARQKQHKGWNYVLSRVWIPKYDLIAFYGDDVHHPKHSTLYYQVKRWASWIKKDRRNDLKRQIGQLNEASEADIAEYSKLSKEMGL